MWRRVARWEAYDHQERDADGSGAREVTKIPQNLSSIARNQVRAAAVEFAIVSSAFISFVIGIAYLGLMLYTDLALHWALENGARLAEINTSTTQTAVAGAINGYLNGIGVPSATVTYTVTVGTPTVAYINATLTQSYTIPMVKTFTITFSADTYVPQSS
jgi:Flp pilus assembly protein TadG